MNRLFFPQRILDSLIDEGKIRLDRTVLTVLARDSPSFDLAPAIHVLRTADNGPDPHGLVGQVMTEREIRDRKAEILRDSVIIGDTAYEIETGFIGDKKELFDSLSDTDLLSRFLLESLI